MGFAEREGVHMSKLLYCTYISQCVRSMIPQCEVIRISSHKTIRPVFKAIRLVKLLFLRTRLRGAKPFVRP